MRKILKVENMMTAMGNNKRAKWNGYKENF